MFLSQIDQSCLPPKRKYTYIHIYSGNDLVFPACASNLAVRRIHSPPKYLTYATKREREREKKLVGSGGGGGGGPHSPKMPCKNDR